VNYEGTNTKFLQRRPFRKSGSVSETSYENLTNHLNRRDENMMSIYSRRCDVIHPAFTCHLWGIPVTIYTAEADIYSS